MEINVKIKILTVCVIMLKSVSCLSQIDTAFNEFVIQNTAASVKMDYEQSIQSDVLVRYTLINSDQSKWLFPPLLSVSVLWDWKAIG